MSKRKNKKPSRNTTMVAHQQQAVSFSGPLPPPVHLEQYEKIFPGAAKIIIKTFEEQSEHRRKLESKVINSGIADSKKGLWFGFIISIVGFIVVGYCAYLDLEILAGIIAALDLASLVGVFVYGSKQKKEERIKKEKIIQQNK